MNSYNVYLRSLLVEAQALAQRAQEVSRSAALEMHRLQEVRSSIRIERARLRELLTAREQKRLTGSH